MSMGFPVNVYCEGEGCGEAFAEGVTADIYDRLVDDHLHLVDEDESALLCDSCAAKLSSPERTLRIDVEDGFEPAWLLEAPAFDGGLEL